MPIRRHGKGWEVRVQHGGRRLTRTVASRSDALFLEGRWQQQVNDRRAGRPASHSIEEALHRWLTGEAKALRSHKNLLDKTRLLYPFAKGRGMHELADVAEEVKAAGLDAGLKPATINRRLAILRRVGKLAFKRWGWLEVDLGARVGLLPGEEERKVQATPAQVQALMAACEPLIRKAVVWAALTGMRKGELLGVEPHLFTGRRLRLTETKTTRPRVIPLAPGLVAKDFPFGITDEEVTRGFLAARERAGMPWLQFRDLRRTCGSWIVQRTRSLKAAQDLLGHSTMTITARHYAHLLDEHVADAVQSLPRLAGQPRGRKKAA
jgi:integrase